MVATAPRLSTAPVLAVLVCHDGRAGLDEVLSALRALTVRPRHVLAVDTGSADGTAQVLAEAEDVLDGVLELAPDTGFGAAVAAAVEHAGARWSDPGRWLWLLHDDSAPEPDCLGELLDAAERDPAAAVLGPLGLDRADPRLVVDAGLSTDASGHRQTGLGASEPDPALLARGAGASTSDSESGSADEARSSGAPPAEAPEVAETPGTPGTSDSGRTAGSSRSSADSAASAEGDGAVSARSSDRSGEEPDDGGSRGAGENSDGGRSRGAGENSDAGDSRGAGEDLDDGDSDGRSAGGDAGRSADSAESDGTTSAASAASGSAEDSSSGSAGGRSDRSATGESGEGSGGGSARASGDSAESRGERDGAASAAGRGEPGGSAGEDSAGGASGRSASGEAAADSGRAGRSASGVEAGDGSAASGGERKTAGGGNAAGGEGAAGSPERHSAASGGGRGAVAAGKASTAVQARVAETSESDVDSRAPGPGDSAGSGSSPAASVAVRDRDEATSDQAGSDQATSDQAGSDQATSDQVGSDQSGGDQGGRGGADHGLRDQGADQGTGRATADRADDGPGERDQAGGGLAGRGRAAGDRSSGELGDAAGLPVAEVLAVSTAGVLVRRDVHTELGGFDPALPLGFEDVDFGWRVNAAGHLVLCVPSARVRHAAALRRGERSADAAPRGSSRVAERIGGVRTFLVNCSVLSFVLGVPRLVVLAALRAAGFGLLRRWPDAGAELAVLRALVTGRMGLRAARAERRSVTPRPVSARGLLTSRITRLRNGLRGAFAGLVRERVRREVVLGRAPGGSRAQHRIGADAVPAVAPGQTGERLRRVAGLRRPGPVVVELENASPRPSPVPRAEAAKPDLLLVEVNRWAVLRELLLAPAVVLGAALLLVALVTHGLVAGVPRFDGVLQGGRLLPAADLGATWSDYVASWHPVNGGTGAPAPASLLVVALLGTVLAPIGGPPAVLGGLLLFGVPLAGLTAYAATRLLPMSRTRRALAAGAYALLPLATWSAAEGRLDVVVAHVLVPPLLAGLSAVLGLDRLTSMNGGSRHWLSTAGLTALGLAALGAFAPLVHVLLMLLALAGFVAVPSEARQAPRRVAGLAAVVVLPVACLLPWSVVPLTHPEVLVHGLGARIPELAGGGWIAALSADGAPATWAGGLLVLAAVAVLVLQPRRSMVPGLVIAVFGWAAAVLVQLVRVEPLGGGPAAPGSPAPALVVAAAGLLWVVLAAGRVRRLPRRAVAGLVAASLLVGGVSAVLAGRGPLRTEPAGGTPALAGELAAPGGTLVLGPRPPRLVEDRQPHFGDDDLAPVPSAVAWLRQADADLRSGDPHRVRAALAAAAVRGAGHVALPPADAARVQRAAGELVADRGRLGDGSTVLRVLLPTGQVELLGPDLARQARLEPAPSAQARPIPVPADSPEVAVRMSAGGLGRTLVLAAEQEPGWQATVDGREAPLATAWGHQVAVPLPEGTAEVRVDYSDSARNALLVVQAAALLFTAIAALPSRRRPRTDT